MTEHKTPESCTIKVKSFWSDFYSAPCFWLKVISLIAILGLAILGLYKIVTSAFYYFDESLSYFDPERLGQLGDFLGGTINPLVGFITIILLSISIMTQRKELKETSVALRSQSDLMRLEQTRAELLPIMKEYHSIFKKTSNSKFKVKFDDDEFLSMFIGDFETICLTDIYHISMSTEGFAENMHLQFINHDPRQYSSFTPIRDQLYEMKSLIEEIDEQMTEYISVAQLKSIERFWFRKYQNALYFCTAVGAISEEDKDRYIEKMQPMRQELIFGKE